MSLLESVFGCRLAWVKRQVAMSRTAVLAAGFAKRLVQGQSSFEETPWNYRRTSGSRRQGELCRAWRNDWRLCASDTTDIDKAEPVNEFLLVVAE